MGPPRPRVFTPYKILTFSQHWVGTTILVGNLQKVNKEFPLPYHTPHHENMMLNGFYEEQVSLQLLQAAYCYLVSRRVELTIFWRTVGRTSTDHTNEFS